MNSMGNIKWHIGCSGFHYKEWKEEFYPAGLAQSKWFNHYTQHFNTLELNVTFYRFPTLKSLQVWNDKSPEGFSFSSKVPRSITHFKKFVDTERMMDDFYCLLKEGLGNKLSCVLTQLPPQFKYSEEGLERIIKQLNPGFDNVIEFRNESWWRKDVMEILLQHKVTFCGVSFPKIIYDDAIINNRLAYYRFHGVPRLFYSEYEESFIEKIYHQLSSNTTVTEAFIYFNNTASTAALHNARQFKKLAGE
jgi:uncharacterized protein YecE (DUF72 family)